MPKMESLRLLGGPIELVQFKHRQPIPCIRHFGEGRIVILPEGREKQTVA